MQISEIFKEGPIPYVARNLAVLWVRNEFATMPAFDRDGARFYRLCPEVLAWIDAAFESRMAEANRIHSRSLWRKRRNEFERRTSPLRCWVREVFKADEIERARLAGGSLPDVPPGTKPPWTLVTVGKTFHRFTSRQPAPFTHKPLSFELSGQAA